IHDQVTDYWQTRQRTQDQLVVLHHAGQRGDTGQAVLAVAVHAVGATDTFTAGATEAETGILLLGQLQNVEHHQVLAFGVDLKVLHVGRRVGLRVVTIATDLLHSGYPYYARTWCSHARPVFGLNATERLVSCLVCGW